MVSLSQAVVESIADYDTALCKLATKGKFRDYLEDALHDRFVGGLSNKAIQQHLLSEPDLTLTKAMELAQGMEAWKPLNVTPNPLKVPSSPVENFVANLRLDLTGNNRVTDVGSQTTHLWIVNLTTLNIIHVERKAILAQFAELNIRNGPTRPVDELRNLSQPMLLMRTASMILTSIVTNTIYLSCVNHPPIQWK